MIRIAVAVTLLALLAGGAAAALIYTAPLERVVPHADLVVRGTLDLSSGRMTVRKTYRGKVPVQSLLIRNRDEIRLLTPGATGGPFGGEKPTDDAIVFLQERDGRHHLVHTSSPSWIAPHAAIKYVGADGKILGFMQVINPGRPLLRPETAPNIATIGALEKSLATWLKAPRAGGPVRPALSAEESNRFYDLLDPWIDLHLRRAKNVPAARLAELTSALAVQIAASEGETRRRRIEALLILAEQRGPDQARRRFVEPRLFALMAKIGPEPFLEPALAELRSPDIFSSKETAARLVRRMGGDAVAKARRILIELVVGGEDVSLATKAYWALRYMGLAEDAEKALAARRELTEVRKGK